MLSHFKAFSSRILIGILLAVVLVSTASSVLAQHAFAQHRSNESGAKQTRTIQGGISHVAVRTGEVNLATLAISHPSLATGAPKTAPTDRQLKTAAQLATYRQYILSHPNTLPQAKTVPAPEGASIYHTGAIPVLQNQAAGLTSVDGGGWYPPDQAIATSSGYVFEGVNNVLKVYNSSYSSLYGPWTPDTFFASVKRSGDTFSDPQITYDAEPGRAVFVISWLEISPSGNDYIDLAISKTSTPSPLSNYYVYQVDPTTISGGSDDFCDYATLGYDYWGLYITCITFSISSGNFIGNNTFAFSLTNMLSGSLGTWDVWNSVTTDLSCGTSCNEPAYRVSPAIEDGFPEAEWIAATDQGFGASSSNLTVCSITNTQALGTGTLPTFTCGFNSLPLSYDDPIGAAEPGTSATVYPGIGFKQFAYRAGKLYFAIPLALSCSGHTHDGILWADVDPQLTTLSAHNPQWQNGLYSNYNEAGYFCFSNADAYMPTIIPSSEGDATLVFNYSSSTVFPSIVFTGRANTDAPGNMGQTGSSKFIVIGTHSNDSGRWGDYSACSLATNGASRGIVYCGGEFGGPNTVLGGFGWDTDLYNIRME